LDSNHVQALSACTSHRTDRDYILTQPIVLVNSFM
jgi:hypothetical protein